MKTPLNIYLTYDDLTTEEKQFFDEIEGEYFTDWSFKLTPAAVRTVYFEICRRNAGERRNERPSVGAVDRKVWVDFFKKSWTSGDAQSGGQKFHVCDPTLVKTENPF